MKTKSFFASAFALLMFANVSAKDINPSFCNSIPEQTNGWNETKSVATLIGIPTTTAKTWTAYALDGSWASWADVTSTWTPGSTTIVTGRVVPSGSYWKATPAEYPGGAASVTKNGFVAFCLWAPGNSAKDQDCTSSIQPSNYDCSVTPCKIKVASYCDNFRACISSDGKKIELSGLRNYSPGNWFAYSDDGWAGYSDITALVGSADKVCVDMAKAVYAAGPQKGAPVNLPLTGSLSMIADANGPNKCTADNNGLNNKNGIDLNNAPVCTSCTGPISVNEVAATSVKISPNPASATEIVTISGVYAQNSTVSVISISGQYVGSLVPTVSADAITISLASVNVSTGIYFVQIKSEGKTFVGKLSVK